MSRFATAGVVFSIITAIAAVIVAGPAIWKFLCLPGRLDEKFAKLDQLDVAKLDQQLAKLGQLDAIADSASRAADTSERAADIAAEAHEEWKGATKVVTHEMARVAAKVDAHDRKIGELDHRVRRLEAAR